MFEKCQKSPIFDNFPTVCFFSPNIISGFGNHPKFHCEFFREIKVVKRQAVQNRRVFTIFFQQNNFTIFHVKSKLCKPVAFSQNLK